MRRNRLALLVAGIAMAGIAGACGDDGRGVLTKDEYINRGDEICADANDEIDERSDELFSAGEPSAEDVERFTLEVSVPRIEQEIEELRELPAPEGDSETVNEIYDSAEEGIAELKEDPSVSAEGELPSGIEESNELARDYGFAKCGEEG